MTSNAPGGIRILGSLRSEGGKGVVRIEDLFNTDIDDLWSALTDPARLARWHGQVEGDLRPGGEFRMYLEADDVESTGRVQRCLASAAAACDHQGNGRLLSEGARCAAIR